MARDRVDNMRMVTVSVEVGRAPQTMDLTPTPQECEFVFGIGREGLTPLEFELVGKHIGDEVLLHIRREDLADTFQHVRIPSFYLPNMLDGCWLKLRIAGIREADQREIIKALADMAGCGNECCGH